MNKTQLLTLAIAGFAASAGLQAQTGLGENYIDATFAIESIDDDDGLDLDTGWGAAGKVNVSIAKNWDLSLSGGVLLYDISYADVYHSTLRAGVTWHTDLGKGKLFITGEAGVDWISVDTAYGDASEDLRAFAGKAGYMFQLSEKVQLGLYGGYRHYDSDFGDEGVTLFGGQLAIRLGRVVSLVGAIEVDDDSVVVGTGGVRFHF
jgi:hypothetical protein